MKILLSEYNKMNSFKLSGWNRKLNIFCPVKDLFELHSIVKEEKKAKDE